GHPFEMIKLRTMREAVDAKGNVLPDAERMTPFGYFLRSTSLVELPELWKVLKGDMSLVGPRPLLMEYLP
ncbi:sugar transferase, partial [Pseudomonas aeruginosa]